MVNKTKDRYHFLIAFLYISTQQQTGKKTNVKPSAAWFEHALPKELDFKSSALTTPPS